MPGVLMIESMAQTCAVLVIETLGKKSEGSLVYFMSVDGGKFRKPVVPGDQLRFHVDKIKAPLFIAQGANDPRVNVDESDQMVKAMKEKGIEVEYLVKKDEGHGFRNEENRFEFYRAMEKFLSLQLSK